MRISDWSSDVCSSDLICAVQDRRPESDQSEHGAGQFLRQQPDLFAVAQRPLPAGFRRIDVGHRPESFPPRDAGPADIGFGRCRSEEHTSELQSLMRISYAVFCLKKKKQTTETTPKT